MSDTRTKIGTWVGFLLILVWCLLPVVWIISLSFKGPTETAAGSPQFLPKEWTTQNYSDIFDAIYVMTRGAQDTESSSFLTYRQVIEQMQLGLGSALSVLLFFSVLLLAFLIVRLFKVDLAQARGEG